MPPSSVASRDAAEELSRAGSSTGSSPSPTDVISQQYRAVLAGLEQEAAAPTEPPLSHPGLNPLRSQREQPTIQRSPWAEQPTNPRRQWAEQPAFHLPASEAWLDPDRHALALAPGRGSTALGESHFGLSPNGSSAIADRVHTTTHLQAAETGTRQLEPTDAPPASVVEDHAHDLEESRTAQRVFAARIDASAGTAASTSDSAAPGNDPNQNPASGAAPPPEDWRSLLDLTIESIESHVGRSELGPHDRVRSELRLRLLQLAVGNYDRAMQRIEALPADEQEFLINQLWSLRLYSDENQTPEVDERLAETLTYVQKAMDSLRVQSALRLSNLVLCTAVDGFGSYTEVKKYEFRPDQPVLLYVEVDNFTATELSQGGSYETELAGSYEILDGDGRRVADQRLPLDKQSCRNRRRDYYLAYQIYMPKTVDKGSYTLQLTIHDVQGGKFSQSSIPLQIR